MRHDGEDTTGTALDGEVNSKLGKLSEIKEKAKDKTKRVLHLDSSKDDTEQSPYEAELEELTESPAFNPTKFLNRQRIGQAGFSAKAISAVQGTVQVITDPKGAIKSRATKKTAGTLAKSRPYLSRKADLDFLDAHNDLQRLEGSRNETKDEDEAAQKHGNIGQCEERIDELDRARLSMRVAWVTSRHVQRVRVVDAVPPPPFPDDAFFEQQDDCGFTEFNWGKWIAYIILHGTHNFTAQYIDDFEELPFDIDTLRKHVERFIIVSAPLQTFLSDVRCIYRWEDPIRTGKWMVLYFFLWYVSHIMSFFYGYIFYSVAMNYYYPTSIRELREGIERSIDRGATAFKVGELMDKHGSDDWLGPLLDELGPFIQVQIADLTNLLEAVYNFYHFRSPPATIASLCLFGALFLITAFTDSRYAMKVFWFTVGLNFFICWPISSLYPKYRLLVSIWKWTLWDVPTHAEWCFQYLQERAAHAKEAMIAHDAGDNTYIRAGQAISDDDNDIDSDESFYSAQSTPKEQEKTDILRFGCTYLHTPGKFIISTEGIRFVSTSRLLPQKSFDKPFSALLEMSKRQTHSSIFSPLAKVTTGMDKLELRFKPEHGAPDMTGSQGKVVLLENMRGRDKAFNAIIGFSGARWQHLQQRAEPNKTATPRS
ncbi:hypothetical protein N431DRAFT_321239 [Stipitochalara longipes BDJ]|nr:hypothetical protein N431DRAFT_321239 [Stipitochalara longipes BDJ]